MQNIVWTIAGMMLAVPLLGMLKIRCSHVEPAGGKTKKNELKEKIKGLFGRK